MDREKYNQRQAYPSSCAQQAPVLAPSLQLSVFSKLLFRTFGTDFSDNSGCRQTLPYTTQSRVISYYYTKKYLYQSFPCGQQFSQNPFLEFFIIGVAVVVKVKKFWLLPAFPNITYDQVTNFSILKKDLYSFLAAFNSFH